LFVRAHSRGYSRKPLATIYLSLIDPTCTLEYLDNTVRVVNSSKLWDNKDRKRRRLAVKPLIGIILVIVGFATVAVIVSKNHWSTPQAINAKVDQPKVAAAASYLQTQNIPNPLPEQDNLDLILKQKLFPPLPPPDCAVEACLALTFDDGPDPATTPVILDALKFYNVKATFFLMGIHVVKSSDLVRRIAADGHELGNHSWAHPDFTKLTIEQIAQQIDQTNNAVVAAGAPLPKIFRPPYEKMNTTVETQVGLPIILWNIDPKDWKQTDPNVLIQMVVDQAKAGGIIVLHDVLPVTAAAIGGIIQNLTSRFRLVTITELLNLQTDSRGVFFGL